MRQSTYRLICLCTLANFINSVDRVIMPITIIAMAQQYRWSIAAQGWVLSSFAVGYFASQIIGATAAASRFGPGNILTISVLLWSMATIVTPSLAGHYPLLILGRIVLGLAEGLGLPMIFQLYAQAVPLAERSRAFGYLISAGTVGQTVAAFVTPHLAWPVMFYTFGLAGFVWVVAWFRFYPRNYEQSTTNGANVNGGSSKLSTMLVPSDEPDANQPFVSVQSTPTSGPSSRSSISSTSTLSVSHRWLRFLSHWPLWAIYIAHFAMNWSNYIIMQWLPYYLSRYLGADEKSLSLTALPYILNAIAGIGAGHLADSLIAQHKWSILAVRRLMTAVGLFGVGLMMLLFSTVRSLASALLVIGLAMSLCAFNSAGHLSNHTDVAPNHAGVTFAISNTFATIPGLLCGPLTAELVTQSQGRWLPVFVLAAGVNFVGAIIYTSQSSAKVVVM